jgi:kynurenine formamidase
LNYRLSAYPNHPTQPSTPEDEGRNVVHLAHFDDIIAGIEYLQEKYGFGSSYVLVGHSVGATLAFQTCMRNFAPRTFKIPDAIVGVAGIYNFPLLVANHSEVPAYREFVTRAFDDDETVWKAVSPAAENWNALWRAGWFPRFVVLGWSNEDELVEEEQGEGMCEALGTGSIFTAVKVKLTGGHDEQWMGEGVAMTIKEALLMMVEEDEFREAERAPLEGASILGLS